ncbi:MAG TPA: hypothetical protein PLO89_07910, partial [Spirochaetota bacterium]|nr:hypothetical protein [Spirochaetota bacterium]
MKSNFEDLLEFDLNVKTIGTPKNDSPLHSPGSDAVNFVSDDDRVLVINSQKELEAWKKKGSEIPTFE